MTYPVRVSNKKNTRNRRFHHGSQRSGRGSMWTQQVMEYENRDLFGILHDLDRKKAIMGPKAAQRRAAMQEAQDEGKDQEEDGEDGDDDRYREDDGLWDDGDES
ncbi:uncharacterized protein LOC144872235 [Branchiostoma floridae x Branchiostoma japonicum]